MLFLYRLICFVGYSMIVSKKFFFVLSSYYTTVWYVGVALQSVPKRVSIGGKLFWNEISWENSQVLDVLEGSKIWKLLLLLLRVFFSKIRWYLSIYNSLMVSWSWASCIGSCLFYFLSHCHDTCFQPNNTFNFNAGTHCKNWPRFCVCYCVRRPRQARTAYISRFSSKSWEICPSCLSF